MNDGNNDADNLREAVAKLQVEVGELRFAAKFDRYAIIFAYFLLAERVWHWLFS